jgi:hypothetical protein
MGMVLLSTGTVWVVARLIGVRPDSRLIEAAQLLPVLVIVVQLSLGNRSQRDHQGEPQGSRSYPFTTRLIHPLDSSDVCQQTINVISREAPCPTLDINGYDRKRHMRIHLLRKVLAM